MNDDHIFDYQGGYPPHPSLGGSRPGEWSRPHAPLPIAPASLAARPSSKTSSSSPGSCTPAIGLLNTQTASLLPYPHRHDFTLVSLLRFTDSQGTGGTAPGVY